MYHQPYEDYSPYIYGRINRILNNRIENGLGFTGGAIRRKKKDPKCKIYQPYRPNYWLTPKGNCIPYDKHITNYRRRKTKSKPKSKPKYILQKPKIKYILPQNIKMNQSKINKQLKEIERLNKLIHKKKKVIPKKSSKSKKNYRKKMMEEIYREIEQNIEDAEEEDSDPENMDMEEIVDESINQINMEFDFEPNKKELHQIYKAYGINIVPD